MDLGRLLRPRSIAVIGGREAARVVHQCDRIGFGGRVHAVNPHRREIAGRRCVARIEDLPEAPDAAFVAVPRERTVDVVRALAGLGAGGAVCYASGFSESGAPGAALQRQLLDAAGEMPVLGPNCYGLLDYLDGVALWPDQHGGRARERRVALLAQSSHLAPHLTMVARGFPRGYGVPPGNQARQAPGVGEHVEAGTGKPAGQDGGAGAPEPGGGQGAAGANGADCDGGQESRARGNHRVGTSGSGVRVGAGAGRSRTSIASAQPRAWARRPSSLKCTPSWRYSGPSSSVLGPANTSGSSSITHC